MLSKLDFEDLPDRLRVLVLPARADREHRLLGPVHELGDVVAPLVPERRDRPARRDQGP